MSPEQSDRAQNTGGEKREAVILFQKYFKTRSRTYAAQVKQASSGDHFLVVTEGRRDPNGGDVRKSWVMVFSEDFAEFFGLLRDAAQFINANPVPEEVRRKQAAWRSRGKEGGSRPGIASSSAVEPAGGADRPATRSRARTAVRA